MLRDGVLRPGVDDHLSAVVHKGHVKLLHPFQQAGCACSTVAAGGTRRTPRALRGCAPPPRRCGTSGTRSRPVRPDGTRPRRTVPPRQDRRSGAMETRFGTAAHHWAEPLNGAAIGVHGELDRAPVARKPTGERRRLDPPRSLRRADDGESGRDAGTTDRALHSVGDRMGDSELVYLGDLRGRPSISGLHCRRSGGEHRDHSDGLNLRSLHGFSSRCGGRMPPRRIAVERGGHTGAALKARVPCRAPCRVRAREALGPSWAIHHRARAPARPRVPLPPALRALSHLSPRAPISARP